MLGKRLGKMFAVLSVAVLLATSVDASVFDTLKQALKRPTKQPTTRIKVLVLNDVEDAEIEVKGKYHLYDPNTREYLSTRFIGKKRLMEPLDDGLKWGEEFPAVHQLEIVPDHLGITTIVDGVEYPGAIYVYDIGRAISVVNEIEIDSYVKAVLGPKVQEDHNEEYLAALVIAARTNAYYNIKNPRTAFWAVDGSTVKYTGLKAIVEPSPIEKAIDTTKRMVLSRTAAYEGVVTPINAVWSPDIDATSQKDATVESRLTVDHAKEMAEKGVDAADILSKAFPGTSIQLIQK